MRVTQTYHLDTTADQPLKQQLEAAIEAMLPHRSGAAQNLPAWVGVFKRIGTLDADLLNALVDWLQDAERMALSGVTGSGTPEENGAMWRIIQQLEDAIATLHWKAGLVVSGASEPSYPRPETEKDGWLFLGKVPPLPFLQTASDRWMDAWGQNNRQGITLMLRYGPGINHAMSETRSDTAWLHLDLGSNREQRKWQAAVDLALKKRLIRVAYPPMVA